MNCYQHGFGALSSHARGSNQAMSEIVIQHDVNQPLTTAYAVPQAVSAEQRQRRQREVAMAKAQAVIRLYGGSTTPTPTTATTNNTTGATSTVATTTIPTPANNPQNLPVAQPVKPPPTAEVIRAPQQPARRRGTASEPGFLALSGTFRKSSSSLMTEDNLSGGGSNHSLNHQDNTSSPPPPPLKTEVTSLLLQPDQKLPALKSPPPGSEQLLNASCRRISDSVASVSTATNTRQQYKERPSFQAHDSLTSSVIPRKPAPTLYPSVGGLSHSTTSNNYRDSTNSEGGGLLRGLAIEEQAHMLQRYQQEQQQQHQQQSDPIAEHSRSSLAVQEQEKLWQQFSRSASPANVATLSPPAATRRTLDPLEEQAQLWEQITKHNNTARSRSRDPLEEQAQLLQAYNNNNRRLDPVEEQERLLRAFQEQQQQHVNPIEEQAKRLLEIQEAKERKVLELAVQLSAQAPAPTTPANNDEEELSLRYIMEMSRREAEDHNRKQQDLERAVLQEALQRSQQELGIQEQLRQHEQSVDLELRRSIAELACQSSERTLDASVSGGGRRSLGVNR